MLKGLQGSQYVQVTDGWSGGPSFYGNGNPTSMAGMVRYNGNSSNFEVYDGYTWLTVTTSYPTVALSSVAIQSLEWVQQRMQEEREWKNSNHPAVKAAMENFLKARQQLEVTAILAEQEENNDKTTS